MAAHCFSHTSPRLLPILSALAVAFFASIAFAQDDWQFEVVDNGRQFSYMTEQHLQLDEDGNPHVAYGKDHLYYAWYDGSAWHSETADSSFFVGHHASLSLDSRGRPHVSYFDENDNDLKYAHRDDTSWIVETVDSPWAVGRYSSMELDTRGNPRISYEGDGCLKYAYRDDETWHIQVVDLQPDGPVGRYTLLISPI